jgi:hypothetical protein
MPCREGSMYRRPEAGRQTEVQGRKSDAELCRSSASPQRWLLEKLFV